MPDLAARQLACGATFPLWPAGRVALRVSSNRASHDPVGQKDSEGAAAAARDRCAPPAKRIVRVRRTQAVNTWGKGISFGRVACKKPSLPSTEPDEFWCVVGVE
jgi:hypothetical protein